MTVRRVKFALFILVLLFLLAELAARVYFATLPTSMYVAFDAISPDARAERSTYVAAWDDRGFWAMRRDTYPTVTAPHTIYMLGSSVMAGQWVTSAETIPSHLQRRLRAYRVVNLAAWGQTGASLYRQAQTLPLRAGDIVVAESVSNDAMIPYGMQYNQAKRYAPLAIVQMLCQPRPDENMARGVAQETLFSVQRARAYTESHGATFLYVVMPYFYSVSPQTERDRRIDGQSVPVAVAIYKQSWSILHSALVGERDVLDLSGLLDGGRMAKRDYYFDVQHFDGAANAIVARAIYVRLFTF